MLRSYAKAGISIAVMLGVVASAPALAANKGDTKVYRWQDEQGASHYGDYVPPEYAGTAHAVLNEHGVEVETVTGPMTDEEKARQAEIDAIEAQAAESIRAAAIRDKVLLSTYLSVAEIEALRDRRIELLGGQIRITQKYLDNLREKLLKLEREAQRFSPYSADPDARPIDEKLARELSETLNSILLYEKTLAKSKDEQRQVAEKFASDIRRFNELQGLTYNNP